VYYGEGILSRVDGKEINCDWVNHTCPGVEVWPPNIIVLD